MRGPFSLCVQSSGAAGRDRACSSRLAALQGNHPRPSVLPSLAAAHLQAERLFLTVLSTPARLEDRCAP